MQFLWIATHSTIILLTRVSRWSSSIVLVYSNTHTRVQNRTLINCSTVSLTTILNQKPYFTFGIKEKENGGLESESIASNVFNYRVTRRVSRRYFQPELRSRRFLPYTTSSSIASWVSSKSRSRVVCTFVV